MLFPNVFIGKIWKKSQKGVYLQRQKISKRCVVWQFKNLKKVRMASLCKEKYTSSS